MRRYYLLGRDTTDGLKRSVAAQEYMRKWEEQEDILAMPDLIAARSGLDGRDAERARLADTLQRYARKVSKDADQRTPTAQIEKPVVERKTMLQRICSWIFFWKN